MLPSAPAAPSTSQNALRRLGRAWPLLLLAGGTALAFALGLHKLVSLEAIVARRDDLRAFVAGHFVPALAIYAAAYAVTVALSLPGGLVLTVLGGFLFGWLTGGAVAALAASVGAIFVFWVAHTSLGSGLAARAGPALERFAQGFRRDAASYLLFLRLVPVFPFWLVNLAPALLGVRFVTYAWTTALGILPGTFAFSVAGAGLDSVIAAQSEVYKSCVAAGRADCRMDFDAAALLTPQLIAAFVALGLVALIPVVLRRFAGRQVPQANETRLDGESRLS